ncbi:hypothetical protein [Acrocarpospora corrugata]|nr:hypothetical protein [Acrocarpospora corrugata]
MIRKLIVVAMLGAGLSAVPSAAFAGAADPHAQPTCPPDPTVECLGACPPGHACVPAPKQCFTTPCPQYDCVPLPAVSHQSVPPAAPSVSI